MGDFHVPKGPKTQAVGFEGPNTISIEVKNPIIWVLGRVLAIHVCCSASFLLPYLMSVSSKFSETLRSTTDTALHPKPQALNPKR